MKQRSVFTLLLLLSSSVVFGQLEKGNYFLQGASSMGFSAEKYTTISGGTSTASSKSTHFSFRPKAGYFIIDNLPVGLSIYTSTYRTKYIDNDNKNSSIDFSIGPFARFYFLPQDKIRPMAEVNLNFGISNSKSTYSGSTNESKYGYTDFGIGAGASYFITDNIAFDLLLSYYTEKYNLKSETHPGVDKMSSSGNSGYKYSGFELEIGVIVTFHK